MRRWHPEYAYPAHVSEFECLSLGSNPGHKVTKKGSNHSTTWAGPYLSLSYQRLRCVATIRRNKYSYILVRDYSDDRLTCGHTRNFRRSTSDGHPMPTGTSFIPLDVLIKCVPPCLMFLRLTVRCAAYESWTTPGLVKTDKTCVTRACLYQVRVYSRKYTQVVGTIFVCSKVVGTCITGENLTNI